MKVIGISGKANHGKSETANILKYKLEKLGKKVLFVNYGDQVKFIAEKYYGWNGKKDVEGRSLLQKIGDGTRKKNKNFWVKIIYESILLFSEDNDYIIIADCRYENEYSFLKNKKLDVVSVRIERPNFENSLTEEQRKNDSETSLDNYDFDFYIKNDDSIHWLSKQCDVLIECDFQ